MWNLIDLRNFVNKRFDFYAIQFEYFVVCDYFKSTNDFVATFFRSVFMKCNMQLLD